MKRSTKILTFAALMAASTLSVSGCVDPISKIEEQCVYGPPPDSTIEQNMDILASETSIAETSETTEESKQEITESTDKDFGPHENEVCVYGPPPRDKGE